MEYTSQLDTSVTDIACVKLNNYVDQWSMSTAKCCVSQVWKQPLSLLIHIPHRFLTDDIHSTRWGYHDQNLVVPDALFQLQTPGTISDYRTVLGFFMLIDSLFCFFPVIFVDSTRQTKLTTCQFSSAHEMFLYRTINWVLCCSSTDHRVKANQTYGHRRQSIAIVVSKKEVKNPW